MPFDLALLELFNMQLAHPAWDSLMILLTTAGLVALPALIPLLWWGRRRPVALALLLSQGAGLAFCLVMQQTVARVRPEQARVLLGQPDFFSFPSGHATLVFAAAAVVMLSDLPRWLRWGAPMLAAAVAISRIAVGHHWPSDVLGGAVLGLGLGLASHGLLAAGAQGIRRWRWLLWPQVAGVLVISFAAWLGLLTGLDLPFSDKQLHFGMFGAVAFWLALWWDDPARPGGPLRLGRWLPWAVLLPFGLALLEEGAQAASPYRTADPVDLACDLAGMLCCYGLAWLLLRRQAGRLVSSSPTL
jgi:membrane-associated phospholipid phosphatase